MTEQEFINKFGWKPRMRLFQMEIEQRSSPECDDLKLKCIQKQLMQRMEAS